MASSSKMEPLNEDENPEEEILHYLETIQPHQLLQQMVCTAFRVSAGCLNWTSFGSFEQTRTKIGQLYLTMASTLKPLQANLLPEKNEIIDDLRRLTVVFEHVEKLVILVAYIHCTLSTCLDINYEGLLQVLSSKNRDGPRRPATCNRKMSRVRDLGAASPIKLGVRLADIYFPRTPHKAGSLCVGYDLYRS